MSAFTHHAHTRAHKKQNVVANSHAHHYCTVVHTWPPPYQPLHTGPITSNLCIEHKTRAQQIEATLVSEFVLLHIEFGEGGISGEQAKCQRFQRKLSVFSVEFATKHE